jgi:hypothetical protein
MGIWFGSPGKPKAVALSSDFWDVAAKALEPTRSNLNITSEDVR